MTITLVAVKGAPLTIAEFDGNFEDLDGRLEYFETGTGQPQPGIVNITAAGNILTFHFEDASTMSVTIPPTLLIFRGEWLAGTSYQAMDIVVGPEATPYSRNRYLVLQAHTAATDFDPDEQLGGEDVYGLLMPSELSRTQEVSATTFGPGSIDAQSYNRCTNASGCTVTIPANATVAFPIDTELAFRQCAAGQVNIVGAGGVTINTPDDQNPLTATVGAVVQVKKVDTNEWDLFGRLELAT